MNPMLTRALSAYHALQPREQRFVQVGAALVAFALVVGLPLRLHSAATQAAARVKTKTADLAYVQSVLPVLASAPQVADSVPLVGVVDASTREAGLNNELRGTEPAGSDGLRVRFEGASFAQLNQWFTQLGRTYGVSVQQAAIERTETPGRVNANIVLARR